MSEVSREILKPLESELAARGIDIDAFVAGIHGAEQELASGATRISWDLFARMLQRTTEFLGGNEAIADFAAARVLEPPTQLFWKALSAMVTPRDIYWMGVLWHGRSLFTVIEDEIEDLPDGRIREVLLIPPPYRNCPEFFHMIKGAMRSAPLALGLPAAEVELRIDGRQAVYLIDPGVAPRPLGPGRRLLRWLVRRRNKSLMNQLVEQQAELQQTLRSRQRTSRIGHELARHIDLDDLASILTRRLAELLQCSGVTLWVRNVGSAEVVLLRSDGVCKGPSDREMKLFTGDEIVGRVELWRPRRSDRVAGDDVLADLLPWISIAVDNARNHAALQEQVEEQQQELSVAYDSLRARERLAAIGTLAAGIAHEINNPVGAILISAELGSMELEDLPAHQGLEEGLQTIVEESLRCKDIVQNILRFARNDGVAKWPCDPRPLIERSMRGVSEYAAERGISLQLDYEDQSGLIVINPTQMEQVVSNLVRNAVDASEPGGQVRLRVDSLDGQLRVRISDDGSGIDPTHIHHVFDPFFTTKRNEGGTGLGLAVVHGIVVDHEGELDVASELGVGSEFSFRLPLYQEPRPDT